MASDTQGREGSAAKPAKNLGRDPEGRMSLGEHLIELRNRLMISAITVLLLSIVGWFLFPWVFDAVKAPIEAAGKDSDLQALINFQGVGQGLNVKLQMAAYIGLILSSPMIIAADLAVRDAGPAQERAQVRDRVLRQRDPAVLHRLRRRLLGREPARSGADELHPDTEDVRPQQIIPYDQYLNLLIKTMLAFGVAFVIPVVMVLLNFMGLVRGKTMLKAWRWIIFLSVAVHRRSWCRPPSRSP